MGDKDKGDSNAQVERKLSKQRSRDGKKSWFGSSRRKSTLDTGVPPDDNTSNTYVLNPDLNGSKSSLNGSISSSTPSSATTSPKVVDKKEREKAERAEKKARAKEKKKLTPFARKRYEVLNVHNEKVPVSTFWKEGKVVMYFIRRFGCLVCRHNASILSRCQKAFAAKGIRFIAIAPERDGMEEFIAGKYFSGEVYADPTRALYKSLKLKKASLASILTKRVRATIELARRRGFEGNFKGDLKQLGGLFILKPTDKNPATPEILLEFRDAFFGDSVDTALMLSRLDIRVGDDGFTEACARNLDDFDDAMVPESAMADENDMVNFVKTQIVEEGKQKANKRKSVEGNIGAPPVTHQRSVSDVVDGEYSGSEDDYDEDDIYDDTLSISSSGSSGSDSQAYLVKLQNTIAMADSRIEEEVRIRRTYTKSVVDIEYELQKEQTFAPKQPTRNINGDTLQQKPSETELQLAGIQGATSSLKSQPSRTASRRTSLAKGSSDSLNLDEAALAKLREIDSLQEQAKAQTFYAEPEAMEMVVNAGIGMHMDVLQQAELLEVDLLCMIDRATLVEAGVPIGAALKFIAHRDQIVKSANSKPANNEHEGQQPQALNMTGNIVAPARSVRERTSQIKERYDTISAMTQALQVGSGRRERTKIESAPNCVDDSCAS